MELCWFSQNYKATFVNKGLICEEMKPWRQRMVCFPLRYRNAISCPSHEKNLLQRSRCRTAHLQKPRAAHAGSTGPRRKPHLRGQPWVSRSWSCYTCRTSPYCPLKKADWPVLHLFFFLICHEELICLHPDAGKLRQERISAVWTQPWTNTR